jgi:ATP synthase protein I
MLIISPGTTPKKVVVPFDGSDDEAEVFKPLTADEARALRKRNPPVSPWRVVVGQGLLGCLVAAATWVYSGSEQLGWSVAYGVLAVVIPAALFARGMASPLSLRNPGAAMMGFFLWEAVKIALTVAMLFAAPKVVTNLSWLAMLAGLVVTMKVYWFVPALSRVFQVRSSNEQLNN